MTVQWQIEYLDFYLVESFSIVHSHDAANHFWYNDHVSQMSFYNLQEKITTVTKVCERKKSG